MGDPLYLIISIVSWLASLLLWLHTIRSSFFWSRLWIFIWFNSRYFFWKIFQFKLEVGKKQWILNKAWRGSYLIIEMPRKASCKDLLSYFEVFTLFKKSLGEFFTKTFFFLIYGILDYLDDFIWRQWKNICFTAE